MVTEVTLDSTRKESALTILLSKYNAPFNASSDPLVHYISLDDQLLIRRGDYSSHVELYRQQKFSIYDPATELTFEVDPLAPVQTPLIPNSDYHQDFLKELYYECGIKAAGRRFGLKLSY